MSGVPIARLFGIEIRVSLAWAVLIAIVTVIGAQQAAAGAPQLATPAHWLIGLVVAFGFLASVVAHELAHALVGRRRGVEARTIVLGFAGGLAPLSIEAGRPGDELAIAISGPLVSLGIAVLAIPLALVAGSGGSPVSVVAGGALVIGGLNLVLGVLSLLPGLPLDGGRLLRAGVWALGGTPQLGTKVAAWSGRVVAVIVGLSGFVVERGSWGIAAAALTAAMGVYLWAGATQALRFADLFSRLDLVTVAGLLRPGVLLPSDISVAEALRRAWEGHARGVVLVDAADRPSAIVDETQMGAVPPERRPWTQATEVARLLEPGLILPLELGGQALLNRMRETPAHEYLVVADDGSPAGIVSTADFARQLQARA